MTDEVRSKLASLPQLAVIARSSAIGYKRSAKSPQAIARELGVSYLLSGTVRWQKGASGTSRIRVVPELVEITGQGTPTSRWQDSFDAVLEDVFRVQAEIATRVAGALKVTLGRAGTAAAGRSAHHESRRLRRLPARRDDLVDRRRPGHADAATGGRLLRTGGGPGSPILPGLGTPRLCALPPLLQRHPRRRTWRRPRARRPNDRSSSPPASPMDTWR